MKKFTLICLMVVSMAYSGNTGATHTFSNSYNSSGYNGYSYPYKKSCHSEKTSYVCGTYGTNYKSFTNTCFLEEDHRFKYAYSGRCTKLRTRDFEVHHYGYDFQYNNSNFYRPSNDFKKYSVYDPYKYNDDNYYSTYNNYSPNYRAYSSYYLSNSNRKSCPAYNMRQLVPQCHYEYSTNNLGCTRPIVYCDTYTKYKFVDDRSYSFTSYGVTTDANKCPVFKLSAAVNGCSYEYIKSEGGCDIPRLVCGTQNTELSGNLKVKADRELASTYAQIESTYVNKTSKIIALNNIKSKFEDELRTNSTDEPLLKYMIASIEEKIDAYRKSDGVTPIFDILY